MKPIHARWIISVYGKFLKANEMITKAFQMSSTAGTLTSEVMEDEDQFAFLQTLFYKDMKNMSQKKYFCVLQKSQCFLSEMF